ncbi:hypothetical protein EON79_16955 [bacterium]|nr:MAG: hypothetical protein EON79_16955 [bacterium]
MVVLASVLAVLRAIAIASHGGSDQTGIESPLKNFRLSIQSIPHTKEDEARSQALDKIHDSYRKRWRESMVAGDLVEAKALALEAAK